MAKKCIVDLSKDEKAELVSLTQKGRPRARKIKRANILLLVDSVKADFEVDELLHTSWLTVLRTRQRYVEDGLDFAINELPRAGRLHKYDHEYRREGTYNLFLFLQPLVGWRHIKVTDQRTKQDFACCMKALVKIHFPEAERIRVVLDNLKNFCPVGEE